MVGFGMDFILFLIPAFNYKYFTSPAGIHGFQAMYFLSSFFNQFGPNAVSFLVAAEVFPTPIRATAHGFSAAWGKCGALLAAVLYNYIDTQTKFYVVPWFGLLGMLLTLIFLPDTTGLDLKEQERRWQCIRDGREEDYHGVAVHPKHLSWWERWRGVGKHYNADLDYAQKIEEMRHDWEEDMQRKVDEKEEMRERREREGMEDETGGVDDGDETWSSSVSTYYKNKQSPFLAGGEKSVHGLSKLENGSDEKAANGNGL